MRHPIQIVITDAQAGERLDRTVANAMREAGVELSNTAAKALIERGAVRVDGTQVKRSSTRTRTGMVLDIIAEEGMTAVSERVDLTDVVIYRDDSIIAVSKPAGLPTHATHDPTSDHAHAAVERIIGDGGYVGVHHRLDVGTSGVLVFTINKAANRGLADAFTARQARKSYLAVVTDPGLDDHFEVENCLGRDRHERRRMRAVRAGGDSARTEFSVLARAEGVALVEARPFTGRTHQIRVHLQGLQAPIFGDTLYGGGPAARMLLHAHRLTLPHPVTGQKLELVAEVPTDFEDASRLLGVTPQ